MAPAYWGLLGFVALSRISELFLSRRNRAAMRARGAEPGRDLVFPLMVFLHAMPFWIIPLEILTLDRPFIPALGWGMLAVFVFAQLLRVWVFLSLRGYWNAQVMVPPDLDPVVVGPYRYIRHPNYLVVILELLSLPLVHTAWISALALTLLNGWVLVRRIGDEEAQLLANPKYREKMGPKKRFIPGVF